MLFLRIYIYPVHTPEGDFKHPDIGAPEIWGGMITCWQGTITYQHYLGSTMQTSTNELS